MNRSFRGPLSFGVIFALIIVGAVTWFSFQPNQSLNVAVNLATNPANILVGDEFTLGASFHNDAGQTLAGATLTVVLPDGIVAVDSPDQRVLTKFLGDISPNGLSHQDFKLVATGSANSVFHLRARLVYGTAASSAQFESDGAIDVVVGSAAIGVDIAAPANVFSGQNFPITVNYRNNTDHPLQGFSLAMHYPPAFSFSSANTPLAPAGNNAWDLGILPVGASGTIALSGNLIGPNGATYPIAANLTKAISGKDYALAAPAANVTLAASPISIAIAVNNASGTVANVGDNLNYIISFTNNANVTFQNVAITARFVGKMFDFSSLGSNGSFNSLANTVSWNGANTSQLLSLAPGQSGSVTVSIRVRSAFPINRLSDKNYALAVNARLQSGTVPAGSAVSSTISVADLTTKLAGKILLASRTYYTDPSSDIANTGPYPPKVNRATQYTVHWLVTNYATDAQNVTISAYLQSGTTCTGKYTLLPASSTFNCNSGNGQISWMIPFIAATTGITGKPFEATFQVSNTPAVNQVGGDVTLVGPTNLTATDIFINQPMQSSVPETTTALPYDTSVPSSLRRSVTQ